MPPPGSMNENRQCAACGARVPSDSQLVWCPVCSLESALDAGQGSGPDADMDRSRREAELPSVRRFGDYELLEEIARGGMGIVYKARQLSLGRVVAIKMILAGDFASDRSVQRFRSEAATAARLQHPHIVAIHEIGECDGRQFFSMDYVEGTNLAVLVRDEPVTPARAAAWLRTIAMTVQFAHEQGVLHRDLKPSNVLIDSVGEPRITDFGLARQIEGDSDLTLSGQVLGSPNFMPPEQAAGRIEALDARSDVYSLGSMLYHLLTGRPPFQGTDLTQVLWQVREAEPVPPRRLNAGVPADLETICLKCLEKEPARRYATARDLADDLGRFLNHRPVLARPLPAIGKAWRWCARHPAVSMLGFTVAALLVALALGSFIAAVRIKRAETAATEQLRGSYLAQARANRFSGLMGQRLQTLEIIARAIDLNPPPDVRLELRNEAIATLALLDGRFTEERPLSPTRRPEQIRFTPDLQSYARGEADGSISIRRVSDDHESHRLPVPAGELYWVLKFSPDARWLSILLTRGSIQVWSIERGEPVLTLPGRAASDFGPDGLRFARINPDHSISVFALPSGAELSRFPGRAGYTCLAYSPDGTRLACGNHVLHGIEVRDADSGQVIQNLGIPGVIRELAWSHDGRRLAAGCRDGRVFVFDAASGELLASLQGHDGDVAGMGFHPAGGLLATVGWDQTMRLWEPADGRQLLNVAGTSQQIQFDPAGGRLGFVVRQEKLGLIELTPNPAFRTLRIQRTGGGPWSAAFSSDNRLLAVANRLGISIWDFLHGVEVAWIPDPGCRSLLFLPDGKNLLACGPSGASLWPLRAEPSSNASELWIGPRQPFLPPQLLIDAALSTDGRTLAVAHQGLSLVGLFDLTDGRGRETARTGVHPSLRSTAISPDGRLVATGSATDGTLRVWEARSGALVRELQAGPGARPRFSPDGSLLACADEMYRIWSTDAWIQKPGLSSIIASPQHGALAFSPDGAVLAVVDSGRFIVLMDSGSMEVLARFEAPARHSIARLLFGPDGQHLVAVCTNDRLQSWDVRLIREQLERLDLDWAGGGGDGHLAGVRTDDDDSPIHVRLAAAPLVEAPDLVRDPAIVPPRRPGLASGLIDLTSFYNARLDEDWLVEDLPGVNLSELPVGTRRFAGVEFDVRGLIQLKGSDRAPLRPLYPRQVRSIPIQRKFSSLHFLHGVFWIPNEGTHIASYIVTYADGTREERPILYGHDVRELWWYDPPVAEPARGSVVAWTGACPANRERGGALRLYKTTWENLRTDVAVESLDFVSQGHWAAPFLIAVTGD